LIDASLGSQELEMSEPDFLIVEAIYPGMMPLDFVGPHAIFTRIPKTTTVVASEPGGSIEAEDGLVFAGVRRMNEVERCDLLFVPGGHATDIIAATRPTLSTT
jgi:cyclohexyl-isocyanide hydratase